MRKLIFTTCTVIGLIAAPVVAKEKAAKKEMRLSEYVLTFAQFSNLNLKQRVEYFKFLAKYLSAVEALQGYEHDGQPKTAQMMERLYELAIAKAYAKADATCITSFGVGEFNGKCKAGARLSDCSSQPGTIACGDVLYKMAKALPGKSDIKGVCITPPKDKMYTAACWNKFKEMAPGLDEAIAGDLKAMYRDESGVTQADFDKFLTEARTALEQFQSEGAMNGMPLSNYCANELKKSDDVKNQKSECRTIQAAIKTFKAKDYIAEPIPYVAAPDPSTIEANNMDGNADGDDEGAVKDAASSDSTAAPLPPPLPAAKTGASEPAKADTAAATTKKTEKKASSKTNLGALECVAKGLADQVGGTAADYNDWVALMAILVQRRNKDKDAPFTTNAPKTFRTLVAEAVASLGYCSNKNFKADALGNDKVSAWIWGKGATDTEIMKAFGIDPEYGGDLLADMLPTTQTIALADRRRMAVKESRGYMNTYPKTKFAGCAKQLVGLKGEQFNVRCEPGSKYYIGLEENRKFRNDILQACPEASEWKVPAPVACPQPKLEPITKSVEIKGTKEIVPCQNCDSKPADKKCEKSAFFACEMVNVATCKCLHDGPDRDKKTPDHPKKDREAPKNEEHSNPRGSGDGAAQKDT